MPVSVIKFNGVHVGDDVVGEQEQVVFDVCPSYASTRVTSPRTSARSECRCPSAIRYLVTLFFLRCALKASLRAVVLCYFVDVVLAGRRRQSTETCYLQFG
jgi:hypothetical protein